MNTPSEHKKRITPVVSFFLIAVALMFDGLQFLLLFLNVIPVIGTVISFVFSWFITFLATTVFLLWFALLGVSYFKGKRAAKRAFAMAASVITELVPLFNSLPVITAWVVTTIVLTNKDSLEEPPATGMPKPANDNDVAQDTVAA